MKMVVGGVLVQAGWGRDLDYILALLPQHLNCISQIKFLRTAPQADCELELTLGPFFDQEVAGCSSGQQYNQNSKVSINFGVTLCNFIVILLPLCRAISVSHTSPC